jgi:glycosyltransferase involved in cell wall biosynthesis
MQQTLDPREYEIIVVDNGSVEPIEAFCKNFPRVRYFLESRPGSYAARNRGLIEARGDVIAFLDADCQASPAWLENGLHWVRSTANCGVVAGRIEVTARQQGRATMAELYEQLFAFDQETNAKNSRCVTANWFSPKYVLTELGGFDSSLMSGSDAALSKLISARGYRVVYGFDAVVKHPARHRVIQLIRKRRRVTGGKSVPKRSGRGRYFLRRMKSAIRNFGRKFIKSCGSRHLSGPKDKIAVAFVILCLLVTTLAELCLLAMGKKPSRN